MVPGRRGSPPGFFAGALCVGVRVNAFEGWVRSEGLCHSPRAAGNCLGKDLARENRAASPLVVKVPPQKQWIEWGGDLHWVRVGQGFGGGEEGAHPLEFPHKRVEGTWGCPWSTCGGGETASASGGGGGGRNW